MTGYTTTAMLYIGKTPTDDEHEAITSPAPGGRFERLDEIAPEGFAGAVYAGVFEWVRDETIVAFCQRMPLDGADVVLYVRGQSADKPTVLIFEHTPPSVLTYADAGE